MLYLSFHCKLTLAEGQRKATKTPEIPTKYNPSRMTMTSLSQLGHEIESEAGVCKKRRDGLWRFCHLHRRVRPNLPFDPIYLVTSPYEYSLNIPWYIHANHWKAHTLWVKGIQKFVHTVTINVLNLKDSGFHFTLALISWQEKLHWHCHHKEFSTDL